MPCGLRLATVPLKLAGHSWLRSGVGDRNRRATAASVARRSGRQLPIVVRAFGLHCTVLLSDASIRYIVLRS